MFKFIFFTSFIFSSCSTTLYLSEQARGQLDLLSKRRSIKSVIKDKKTQEQVKVKLKLVEEIRSFIENELSLDLKGNYKTYVDLGRPWVVQTLTASKKCEIKAHTWSFPIVGIVPYLGFFKKESAIKKQKELIEKNYDTYLRPTTAYSTLGWFNDPILSTFIDYEDHDLVATIIHETVHVNIFKKNNMEFNENIAVFIEEEGTKLFLEKKYGKSSSIYQNYICDNKNTKKRIGFLKKVYQQMKNFYKKQKNKNLSCKEIETLRVQEFQKHQNEYKKHFNRDIKLNNALLVHIALYNVNYESLQDEYNKKFNSNLKKFIEHYKNQ